MIGLVLAALSLGYWLGGRVADRHPRPRVLGGIVVAAGALVAVVPVRGAAAPRPDACAASTTISAGAVVGSFLGSLAALRAARRAARDGGAVRDPARRRRRRRRGRGRRAGCTRSRRSGASSACSCRRSSRSRSSGRSARSSAPRPSSRSAARSLLRRALARSRPSRSRRVLARAGRASSRRRPGCSTRAESRYQFVQVVQNGPVRDLYLNEGIVEALGVAAATRVLTGDEWDMFLAVPPLLGRPVRRVAILGNAGGTTARAYARFYPRRAIDGVEIDPAVTEAARRFMGLGSIPAAARDHRRRAAVPAAHARPLRPDRRRRLPAAVRAVLPRDAASSSGSCARGCGPGGIVALNVATVPGDHRLAEGVAGTLAHRVSRRCSTWQALRLNQLVLGFDRPALARGRCAAAVRAHAARGSARWRGCSPPHARPAAASAEPWTDDRAPVEWVTDRMILDFAAARRLARRAAAADGPVDRPSRRFPLANRVRSYHRHGPGRREERCETPPHPLSRTRLRPRRRRRATRAPTTSRRRLRRSIADGVTIGPVAVGGMTARRRRRPPSCRRTAPGRARRRGHAASPSRRTASGSRRPSPPRPCRRALAAPADRPSRCAPTLDAKLVASVGEGAREERRPRARRRRGCSSATSSP